MDNESGAQRAEARSGAPSKALNAAESYIWPTGIFDEFHY